MRHELSIARAPLSETADRLSTVARLAASARLKELDDDAGLVMALRYRLVSPWTNWLVIATRPEAEQAQDLPALRKVPQTRAAGWGGVGMVAYCASPSSMPGRSAKSSRRDARSARRAGLTSALRWTLRARSWSDVSRLLVQVEDVKRGVGTLTGEARHAFESIQGHAQQAEPELQRHGEPGRLSAERDGIETLQGMAEALLRKIGDASPDRDAIYQQLLMRLADFRNLSRPGGGAACASSGRPAAARLLP